MLPAKASPPPEAAAPSSEQERKKSAVPAKPGDGAESSPGTPGHQAEVLIVSAVAAKYSRSGSVPWHRTSRREPADASRESVPASATPEGSNLDASGPASPVTGLPASVAGATGYPRASRAVRPASFPREPAVPAPQMESYPTGRAERPEVPARVTVEEVRVETRVAVTPPQVQNRRLQRDVEVADRQGESPAGAPRSEGLAPQSQQPVARDGATAAEAPAPLRHPEDAPANAGATDRVTLHLPDEAGGGRIQIAVSR